MDMVTGMDLDLHSGGSRSRRSTSTSTSTRLSAPLSSLSISSNELTLDLSQFPGQSNCLASVSSFDSTYEDLFDFDRYEQDFEMGGLSSGSSSSGNTPALTDTSTTTPPVDDHLDFSLPPNGGDLNAVGKGIDGGLDLLLIPTVDRQSPPREPRLEELSATGSPPSSSAVLANPSSTSQTLPASKRPRSQTSSSNGSSRSKKPRSEMRENGACIRCRIKRTRCDVRDCEHCKKLAPKHFGEVCIHDHLSAIGPVFRHIANKSEDPSCCEFNRSNFTKRAISVPVSFSSTDSDPKAPKLYLSIQEYKVPNSKAKQGPNCTIPRDATPSWEALTYWAGEQILHETTEPFMQSLATFFMRYVVRLDGGDIQLPRLALLKSVWMFIAMFKIWRTHPRNAALYCSGSSKGPVRLPPSVHEELRHIAKKAMESVESKILDELELCMTQAGGVLKNEERPLLWVCLWGLIWCYRRLLRELVALVGKIDRDGDSSHYLPIQTCRDVTSRLYSALIAIYTGYFDKPKSLQMELDLSQARAPFQIKNELEGDFKALLDKRIEFYRDLQKSTDEVDELLNAVIVESELKRLLNPRRKKPVTTKEQVTMTTNSNDDDNDDDNDNDEE